jgi:pimeloyl-ACP methyl ester carboxylesterase
VRNLVVGIVVALGLGGCASTVGGPRVIYLDGSGWFGGERAIRAGLRAAGYAGTVERFGWTAGLGPLPDHLAAGAAHPRVPALVDRIVELRRADPNAPLVVVGLSAGTGLIVAALERLPDDVAVDHAVLLSPSVSSRKDLTAALRHVRGRLYATRSPHDALLAAGLSAGLATGRPAGKVGFARPDDLPDDAQALYAKVVTLDWRPAYAAYGWTGGHVNVISRSFIQHVIAPRILTDRPHPLDGPPPLARRDGDG